MSHKADTFMRRRFDYLESELYLRTHTYKSPFLLNPFRATGRSVRWRKAMTRSQPERIMAGITAHLRQGIQRDQLRIATPRGRKLRRTYS
jgi:hypothetical protein